MVQTTQMDSVLQKNDTVLNLNDNKSYLDNVNVGKMSVYDVLDYTGQKNVHMRGSVFSTLLAPRDDEGHHFMLGENEKTSSTEQEATLNRLKKEKEDQSLSNEEQILSELDPKSGSEEFRENDVIADNSKR